MTKPFLRKVAPLPVCYSQFKGINSPQIGSVHSNPVQYNPHLQAIRRHLGL